MKKAKKIISLIITVSMAFTILPIQIKNALADDKDKIINFKNENLKNILINNNNIDSNNDGEISVKELEEIMINGKINPLYRYSLANSDEDLINLLAGREFNLRKGVLNYKFAQNIENIFQDTYQTSYVRIKLTSSDESILEIDSREYNFSGEIYGLEGKRYSYISFLPKKIGEVTVYMELGDIKKNFKIKVEGIDENQPLGDKVSLNSEIYYNRWPKNYTAYVKDKGQVWDISKETPKLMVNKVKKYVAGYIYNIDYVGKDSYKTYEVETYSYLKKSSNLALDSNNTLWSWGCVDDDEENIKEKEITNVKDFDTRYALKNNNELWEYYGDKNKVISDVKDWESISNQEYREVVDNRLVILKNDNSVWGRIDSDISKKVSKTGEFIKLSNNVVKVVSYLSEDVSPCSPVGKTKIVGFITDKGEYYTISKDLKIEKVCENVKDVIEGFIVKDDNTTWSNDGKKKLINSEISKVIVKEKDKRYEYYLINSKNTMWRYYDGDISNVSEIIDDEEHILKFNNIDLLTNVVNEYDFRDAYCYNEVPYQYLALRSDGSIWAYGNDIVPTMIINGKNIPLNGDLDGNDKVNSFDALKILKISSKGNITEEEKKLADINKDGKVNSLDALKVLQYATGKIDKLE